MQGSAYGPNAADGPSSIDDIFGQVAGLRIAGGCDDCDAFQEVTDRMPGNEQVPGMPGIWFINVSHDDGCPTLARHQRRRP